MPTNPLAGWTLDQATSRTIGHDLQRSDCILAERDGTLWSADARGGVMQIAPDGTQRLIAQTDSAQRHRTKPEWRIPVIANFGTDAIELMRRDGWTRTLYTHIDAQPLGKVNFVLCDSHDRIWFTVATRLSPWTRSINEKVADGYVGTNEIRFDANEERLYVVESNARRISRLRVRADGSLWGRETYGPQDLRGTPDGFAFDSFGNLWITIVQTDRLIALTPQGDLLTLIDDCDLFTRVRGPRK